MGQQLRVLIVGDDPAEPESVERALRAGGILATTLQVGDEDRLLEAVWGFLPDIVLAAVGLRPCDVPSVLRVVASRRPGLPVVALAETADETAALECVRQGAVDYVPRDRLDRLPAAFSAALEPSGRRPLARAPDRQPGGERPEQLALLTAVLDSSDAAVFVVDRELRYVAFNRAYVAVVHALYGGQVQIGAPVSGSVTVAEDWERTRSQLARALAGERLLDEAFAGSVPRLRRCFAIQYNPVLAGDGQVSGAVVVAQDVSHRRRQEERLRQLHRAVEQSPVSIEITDAEGAIEYVNPRFEQVTGYPAEEVIGRDSRILKSGETDPRLFEELWAALGSGRVWAGEILSRRKDGSQFWGHVSVSCVRDAAGRTHNYVAAMEDVTERKRAQQVLKETERQLMQAQKMEAIGRLAGGVAHDFNNLLSVIHGHGERLIAELGDHPQRDRIRQILWAAEKAASLTHQLLAFSRRQVLEPRVIRLDAVVSDARSMVERVIGEDVELAVVAKEGLGSVRADPGQMVQVLLNLVVNARDAMPKGGRLTIEFENVELDGRYAEAHPPCHAGHYLMMAVTDTGHGMDAETQRRIFEPFFTTKPEGVGTGLGLATVYGIVKQSGGFVWVYSEIGLGTTFKIYLPIVVDGAPQAVDASAPAPVALGAASRAGRRKPARILLVEDDDGVRDLMADVLESQGHVVITTARPAEALPLAASLGPFELLVSDVIMPGMSGRELARQLVARQPGLRVLYVSGYAGESLARRGEIERGERFLQKPFSERALIDGVADALNGRDEVVAV